MIENTIAMVEIIDWWSRTTIAMVEIHDWWLRMTIAIVQNTIDDWENDWGSRMSIAMSSIGLGGTYTKHGPGSMDHPCGPSPWTTPWTRSMDHLCGPGPWTTPSWACFSLYTCIWKQTYTKHGPNLIDHPGPWTTWWTTPYFQKQIVPVSVKVRLGTLYRTQTYDTQYPDRAF